MEKRDKVKVTGRSNEKSLMTMNYEEASEYVHSRPNSTQLTREVLIQSSPESHSRGPYQSHLHVGLKDRWGNPMPSNQQWLSSCRVSRVIF